MGWWADGSKTGNNAGWHYVLAYNRTLHVSDGWVTYEAWVMGASGTSGTLGGTPLAPAHWAAGTVAIEPIWFPNYNSPSTDQISQIDLAFATGTLLGAANVEWVSPKVPAR